MFDVQVHRLLRDSRLALDMHCVDCVQTFAQEQTFGSHSIIGLVHAVAQYSLSWESYMKYLPRHVTLRAACIDTVRRYVPNISGIQHVE